MMNVRVLQALMVFGMFAMQVGVAGPPVDSQAAIAAKGERVTMQGIVSGLVRRENGYIFINVGGPFPDHQFAVIIHQLDVDEFPKVDSWVGCDVAFSGVVDVYNDKPMIRIRKPADVVMVSKPNAPAD